MTTVSCSHKMNGRLIPCPSLCPSQSAPRYMWRTDWRGRWVLRRAYRGRDMNRIERAALQAWGIVLAFAAIGGGLIGLLYLLGWVS